MAVTKPSDYLKNTTGGAFTHAKQGGTILNNNNTTITNSIIGDGIITNAFQIKDAVAENSQLGGDTRPKEADNGIIQNQKILSGGGFAYDVAGEYVIARSTITLAGVSKTNLLSMGRGGTTPSIAQFYKQIGAKTLTAFRNNRFSWTNTKRDGSAITSRPNWLNVASGGMDTATAPSSIDAAMHAPGGSSRNGTGAQVVYSDAAANPTRAIPGRLVIQANFTNDATERKPWTATRDGGSDFYDYKAITG